MRVELEVNLRPTGPGPVAGKKSVADPEIRAERQHRDRKERWLRRIALRRVIEARIDSGEFTDLADVARRSGVSKTRVSNLADVAATSRSREPSIR